MATRAQYEPVLTAIRRAMTFALLQGELSAMAELDAVLILAEATHDMLADAA